MNLLYRTVSITTFIGIALFAQIPSIRAQNWDQAIKAVASDRAAQDYFGWSVAISGDYAIVGAPYEQDGNGGGAVYQSGSAYIFKKTGAVWVQQQKLAAPVRASTDLYGRCVAISGDYALVGSANDDEDQNGANTISNTGSVYIYKRTGTVWNLHQKLVANDRAAFDKFGWSLQISGTQIIVGAIYSSTDVNSGDFMSQAGSAYIFQKSGETWVQQQKIVASDRAIDDQFGCSVAIDGNQVIVGALNEEEDVNGLNTLTNAGSAYIFVQSGGVWTQQSKIVPPDRGTNDQFGYSVATQGNHIVVGAPYSSYDANGAGYDIGTGSAYIYNQTGGVWGLQQKIVAADRAMNDFFAFSIAISGNTILSGAYRQDTDANGGASITDAGAAYMFSLSGGVWQQTQKIVASDRAEQDRFGWGVAISGANCIVGASYEDNDANGAATAAEAGSVYLFGDANAFVFTNVIANGVSCFGDEDGDLTISLSGGTPPYQYSIDGGNTYQASPSFTNLDAGAYDITVVDASNTSLSQQVVINEPQVLTATLDFEDVLCFGACTGTASVVITGGTPNYSYNWNDGQNTPSVTGLCTGQIGVTVTDANGCSASTSGSIGEPTELTVDQEATDALCNGSCDGTGTVSISGGTPSYSILWADPLAQTTALATGLCAGITSVSVTDGNGCVVTTSVTVGQPAAISVTISQTDLVLSSDQPTGNEWFAVGNANVLGTNQTYTVTAPGDYYAVYTDAFGCSTTSNTINVIAVGVADVAPDHQVTVYPNPSAGTFTIVAPSVGNALVEMIDVAGRVVLSQQWLTTNATSLTIHSNLEAGIYTVAVTVQGTRYKTKVIVAGSN